ERGQLITLKLDGHTLEVRPELSYTVGDFLQGAGLVTAVSLGVNRPRYVEAALWQALADRAPARERAEALLRRILPWGATDKVRSGVQGLSGAARAAYAELQALLWPGPLEDGRDAALLERAFTERALALYRPEERARRARRLITGR